MTFQRPGSQPTPERRHAQLQRRVDILEREKRDGVIFDQKLTETTASITVPDIPQYGRVVRLHVVARSTFNDIDDYAELFLRVNGDEGTNYDWSFNGGGGDLEEGYDYGGYLGIFYGMGMGFIGGASADAGRFSHFIIDCHNYSLDSEHKRFHSTAGYEYALGSIFGGGQVCSAVYLANDPVTSISVGTWNTTDYSIDSLEAGSRVLAQVIA